MISDGHQNQVTVVVLTIWVTPFAKGAHSALRKSESKYSLGEVPHPYDSVPRQCQGFFVNAVM